MTPDAARVAVHVGGTTVRVAMAGGALVAELPGGSVHAPDDMGELLASLCGPAPPRELVLVHPADWSAERVAAWPGRPVPAPVAAAGRIRRIVVEARSAATDVTLVHAGRVVLHHRSPVGGVVLDAAVAGLQGGGLAQARPTREALSLQPTAGGLDAGRLRVALVPLLGRIVDLVRAVHDCGAAPVLVIGGLARSPLLAELLDEAGIPEVEVAPRPEAAAVLGALAFPIVNTAVTGVAGPVRPVAGSGGAVPGGQAAAAPQAAERWAARPGPPVPAAETGRTGPNSPAPPPPAAEHLRAAGPSADDRWLPAPPASPGRRARRAVGSLLAAGTVAALLAAGSLLPPPRADAAAVPAGVLVQYGYRFDVPAGWEHSGGLPERRRSLLSPDTTPEGSDLIAVERTPLGYDTAAEPERARTELRATYDAAVSTGSALSGYGTATVAGRPVTSYRQRDGASTVDWFVVLDGDAQLSVGCRHTPAGERAVLAACAVVVGSVRRA